jgi:hypothetical protein
MDIKTAPLSLLPKDGDAYVDIPVGHGQAANVDVYRAKPISARVRAAFGGSLEDITIRTQRVPLRWMRPDGKGGLVPR